MVQKVIDLGTKERLTYISLFSSAGVGCFGFKKQGFKCIATNELVERRIAVQIANNKCDSSSGYICGSLKESSVKQRIYEELKKEKIEDLDVLIATPPCQGMSVANHKKNDGDKERNSLVVESINMVIKIKPKIFIFENVPAFMKTICTDNDGNDKSIGEAISVNLGNNYAISSQVLNFKDYGACSSRTRCLVIGVRNDLSQYISPIELYPSYEKEKTLKEVIGNLKSLKNIGEIDDKDIYHNFRKYPEHMRSWISGLDEGKSAFDNKNPLEKPHRIINGEYVLNKRKNADKYTRQYWNKVGPCIHTRNDQLASQNTIHPSDDRVFSIRELMMMMTIPDDFKWTDDQIETLNKMSFHEKQKYLKKNEINIRQCIGEAVPTIIMSKIASNINYFLKKKFLKHKDVNKIIVDNSLLDYDNLISYIDKNPSNYDYFSLSKTAELCNSNRQKNSAYYTDKIILTHIYDQLPEINKDVVRILEPSVGAGNFLPFILIKYSKCKNVILDLIDIDLKSIEILKCLLKHLHIPENIKINFICADFLKYEFKEKYDLVIGNPPFTKINTDKSILDVNCNNLAGRFIVKSIRTSNYVSMVMPKFLLNTLDFREVRDYISTYKIDSIIDFGELGFKGVKVETINIAIDTVNKIEKTFIKSISKNKELYQKQSYFISNSLPYWIIYRNKEFDKVFKNMELGIFDVFRDRQITNSILVKENGNDKIRVLRSRNIKEDGSGLINIDNYDCYLEKKDIDKLSVKKFYNRDNAYLVPNMTYKPRMIKMPKNVLVNGSVAILIPKYDFSMSEEDMKFFSSEKYRNFYEIARNYQTRSLNIDKSSVYFFGRLKNGK